MPRFLYWLTLSMASVLILLVLVTPTLDNGADEPHGASRYLALFARDPVLRRTAVASAIGLTVTACVCFRTPRSSAAAERKPQARPPHGNVVGA
jgi:hypothetical protein